QAHRSLIWFTVWSSVVHGGIMAVQSMPAAHSGHRVGDVPALFLIAIVLGGLLVWSEQGQAKPLGPSATLCDGASRGGVTDGRPRMPSDAPPTRREKSHAEVRDRARYPGSGEAPARVGEEESTMSKPKTRTLGAVIYEDFELLDLYGPLEMFGSIG